MNTSTKCYVSTTALVIQSASAYHITPYTAHSMQTKISPFVQTLVCQHLPLIRPTWHTHTHTHRPPFTSHHHFILMHSFNLIHSFIHSLMQIKHSKRERYKYLPSSPAQPQSTINNPNRLNAQLSIAPNPRRFLHVWYCLQYHFSPCNTLFPPTKYLLSITNADKEVIQNHEYMKKKKEENVWMRMET